jgi:hypothetical protein
MPPVWQWVHYKILESSTLSAREQVELIGTYLKHRHHRPTTDIESRGYTPEQLAIMRKHKGEAKTERGFLGLVFGDLGQFDFPNFALYVDLFSAYDNHGTLPDSGPLLDQPAKIMEILGVLKSIQSEEMKLEERKLEREQKRNKRR